MFKQDKLIQEIICIAQNYNIFTGDGIMPHLNINFVILF